MMPDRICAWCGEVLEKDVDTERDSHGICEKCRDELLKDTEKETEEEL
jgi:hypothetical protein